MNLLVRNATLPDGTTGVDVLAQGGRIVAVGPRLSAPEGTPVYATADGTVSLAGWKDNAYGKSVEIKHANGYKSQYAHLSKVATGLKRDSQVTQGEIIGYVGSTGISTGPHLQYALFQNVKTLQPHHLFYPNQIFPAMFDMS